MQVLVNVFHPRLAQSMVNRAWVARLATAGVTLRDMYALYPDGKIDVAAEQAALLAHELNLFAYHLPLDQHPELGNNAHFAKHFACEAVWQSAEEPLIWHARIAPTTLPDLLAQLEGGAGA